MFRHNNYFFTCYAGCSDIYLGTRTEFKYQTRRPAARIKRSRPAFTYNPRQFRRTYKSTVARQHENWRYAYYEDLAPGD